MPENEEDKLGPESWKLQFKKSTEEHCSHFHTTWALFKLQHVAQLAPVFSNFLRSMYFFDGLIIKNSTVLC
jgi:hypothetical protein